MSQARDRSHTLQQAAAVVFAMVAILPLLVFVWTLSRLDVLETLEAALGLGLALAVALVGFACFRVLMGRLSELVQAVGRAVERKDSPTADPEGPQAGGVVRGNALAAPPAADTPAAPQRQGRSSAGSWADLKVPGLRAIREVEDLDEAIAILWKQEAMALRGRRVHVSTMTSLRPIAGTLVGVTDDGLLLEDGSEQVVVGYKGISTIDPT